MSCVLYGVIFGLLICMAWYFWAATWYRTSAARIESQVIEHYSQIYPSIAGQPVPPGRFITAKLVEWRADENGHSGGQALMAIYLADQNNPNIREKIDERQYEYRDTCGVLDIYCMLY
jgi:hypothetical protein